MRQRGFTLIELCLVCGIGATLALAFLMPVSWRQSAGANSSASIVDAVFAQARAVAATSGNGATVVFKPRLTAAGTPASGFSATVYAGRPNGSGPLRKDSASAIGDGNLQEASLGSPPFTIFLDSAGHASGVDGAADSTWQLASQPLCPPSGALALTVSGPGISINRVLPCQS